MGKWCCGNSKDIFSEVQLHEKETVRLLLQKKLQQMNFFFCSLNIWSIFATRKRNGIAQSNNAKLRKKVRTGLKMVP